MLNPGYRYRSLGELSDPELLTMLGDDETLFTEHKADLKEEAYNVAKAAASFANTLGGWVLIGVTKGEPIADWRPPEGAAFVDAVGERLANQIDPLPSFAASVRTIKGSSKGWDGRQVGVVRVYESADTPHVMKQNGVVYVRETAKDRKAVRPGSIGSHVELARLAEKGDRSRADAERRLAEGQLPLIEDAMGLKYTMAAGASGTFRTVYSEGPAIVVRLVPLTITPRFADWATSSQALIGARYAATLTTGSGATVTDPIPHPQGLSISAREQEWRSLSARGSKYRRRVTVAVDAAGAVAMATRFETHGTAEPFSYFEFTRERVAEQFIKPPLAALTALLERYELYGRYVAHMYALRLSEVIRTADDKGPGATMPFGGELSVPASEGPELVALANRWTYALARGYGLPEFAPSSA